jgi:hypothetical protein
MTPEIAKLLETRDQWAQQALEQYEPLVTHIHPSATASYIQAYRDMWDEEGVKFGNNKKKEEKA